MKVLLLRNDKDYKATCLEAHLQKDFNVDSLLMMKLLLIAMNYIDQAAICLLLCMVTFS